MVCVCSLKAVEELHRLWRDYVTELCMTSDSFNSIVKGMILHGCNLKVTEARNPMLVGLEGIVFETSSAFLHMASATKSTKKDSENETDMNARMFHVPKKGSIFTCSLPGKKEDRLVTISGSNLT